MLRRRRPTPANAKWRMDSPRQHPSARESSSVRADDTTACRIPGVRVSFPQAPGEPERNRLPYKSLEEGGRAGGGGLYRTFSSGASSAGSGGVGGGGSSSNMASSGLDHISLPPKIRTGRENSGGQAVNDMLLQARGM